MLIALRLMILFADAPYLSCTDLQIYQYSISLPGCTAKDAASRERISPSTLSRMPGLAISTYRQRQWLVTPKDSTLPISSPGR